MTHRLFMATAIALIFSAMALDGPAKADTLQDVRARGAVRCGVGEVPGFATRMADGSWTGFMVDICRAVAAVVLGSAEKVTLEPTEVANRFQALADNEIDVLVDGTTWTLARESDLGLEFPIAYYYDGQGFMAAKAADIHALTDIGTARVCVVTGTTTQRNLTDYLSAHGLTPEVIANESYASAWDSFAKGRCQVLTNDRVFLQVRLATQFGNPEDYEILSEVISREPWGPTVRGDDRIWSNIIRWTVLTVIAAEELGVTSANSRDLSASQDAQIMALTGRGEDHGKALGLEAGWMQRVIAQVGNYGEIFDRGLTRTLGVRRGQNALWRNGGYIYAPPLY